MNYQIAIDGPAGAGKSTIAKLIAKRLGFLYIDTGAMYRAMGLHFDRSGIWTPDDVERLAASASIDLKNADGELRIYLNNEDVSREIRTESAGMSASKVSAYPKVRERLVKLQREVAKSHSVVMDGRDIGTVVLPNADLKVFLTAEVGVRAMRRRKQLSEKGVDAELSEVEKDMMDRDRNDSSRAASPLAMADDAVLVDSSNQSVEETAAEIIKLFMERIGK